MHAKVQFLDDVSKFSKTSKLAEALEEKLLIYAVKGLDEVDKSDMQGLPLFSAFLHYLMQNKDPINCTSAASVA